MAAYRRILSLAVVFSVAIAASACGEPSGSSDAVSIGEGEDAFSVDIPQSEKLLAEAVKMAEKYEQQGGCETEIYRSDITAKVQQAIAVRNTVWFRTRVVAKKAVLARVLTDTLDWQAILGVYDPTKPDTLVAAANAGFSLWDTNGGVFGNKQRIQLRAGGKAVVLQINEEDFTWMSSETTWSYSAGRLTIGAGTVGTETYGGVYDVTNEGGMLGLTPRTPNGSETFWSYISEESECEA